MKVAGIENGESGSYGRHQKKKKKKEKLFENIVSKRRKAASGGVEYSSASVAWRVSENILMAWRSVSWLSSARRQAGGS